MYTRRRRHGISEALLWSCNKHTPTRRSNNKNIITIVRVAFTPRMEGRCNIRVIVHTHYPTTIRTNPPRPPVECRRCPLRGWRNANENSIDETIFDVYVFSGIRRWSKRKRPNNNATNIVYHHRGRRYEITRPAATAAAD